ncbi:Z1 domain-containing protein [Bacillus inaquosorum]|uniref:Z1 domain-containing protein n=1 Tax=Bacillus inaquosorum TaxID=483913 RepID=UPI0034CF43EF
MVIEQKVDLNVKGLFYKQLDQKNVYSVETKVCIENTLSKLIENDTSLSKPGMLLGKIQSGKTRTFIGVTALSFDNGYDVAIILTKGTKALAQQTYERLKTEFEGFKYDDVVQIFDIMSLPDNLTNYELDQKMIFIVKKQKDNLKRLQKALFETYPSLAGKRVLMIDDEADFASVGFTKTKSEIIEIKVIAGQIDGIRQELLRCDFLQVTATPYSLYLQPENIEIRDFIFKPIKPAFTELVPVPKEYIGGDYYFKESGEKNSVAYYLYEPISADELVILKKQDRRRFKIEESLNSNKIRSLRQAVLNFIVGGIIRRIQDKQERKRQSKYSFIIHTEQKKQSHEWQEEVVTEIKEQLCKVAEEKPELLIDLVKESYLNLKQSLFLLDCFVPEFENVKYEVIQALRKDHIMITKVNSEKDVNELLDDTGQLKLRVPLNIFIGGQILDRGITIGNLIGFYYGRNPKTFQQDTVLQHSRMFGYRPIQDLAVTRFYTTKEIYDVMSKIHEFDTALRTAIEKGGDSSGVVFIQKDTANKIIPCSPNKIVMSKITTLKPLKRLLPVGFQTRYKSYISKTVEEIDKMVDSLVKGNDPVLIDLKDAISIIKKINQTFDQNDGEQWDVKAFISSMEYLANNIPEQHGGKVWCIVRKGRNIARIRKSTGRYEDAPDTATGTKNELNIARNIAFENPALILTRQQGSDDQEKGWRGAEFWWPVLVAPESAKTVIFTSEVQD